MFGYMTIHTGPTSWRLLRESTRSLTRADRLHQRSVAEHILRHFPVVCHIKMANDFRVVAFRIGHHSHEETPVRSFNEPGLNVKIEIRRKYVYIFFRTYYKSSSSLSLYQHYFTRNQITFQKINIFGDWITPNKFRIKSLNLNSTLLFSQHEIWTISV